MAIRISEMVNRPVLEGSDLFEICHIATAVGDQDGHKTFSVSAETIANYCKTLNNGGFKGSTTSGLDDFTYADAGVYFWSGDPGLSGMPTTGILEVLSYAGSNESYHDAPTVVERLTAGAEIYVRSWEKTNGWSSWAVLANKNGNRILSGRSSDGSVNFNTVAGMQGSNKFFNKTPVVVITPINASADKVCIANIQSVDSNSFSVARFESSTLAVATSENVNRTYETANNERVVKTETQTVETTRGQWTSGSFAYDWIATVDG